MIKGSSLVRACVSLFRKESVSRLTSFFLSLFQLFEEFWINSELTVPVETSRSFFMPREQYLVVWQSIMKIYHSIYITLYASSLSHPLLI